VQLLSLTFGLFLLVGVPLYWLAPARLRPHLLLLLSLGFYAAASTAHALLIVALALFVFAIGEALQRRPRRRLLALGVLVCVAVLGVYKYSRLLVRTAQELLPLLDLYGDAAPVLAAADQRLLLLRIPLGISFFTFEFVHYLVDAHAGRLEPPPAPAGAPDNPRPPLPARLLKFLLFALFFPTLLAGPIKRYQQFGPPAASPREPELAAGLGRILIGLAKKVLFADTLALAAARLSQPELVTPAGLWLGMYAYAGQIYLDFSGYSDLAIGTALLFGYRVPENFDWPYRATSLQEFWRRWHISLSSWIRDYLFIPLGGSRRSRLRVAVNLLVVMALCGLWHGPAWHFVAWGLWHGTGLGLSRLWRLRFPPPERPGPMRRLGYGLLTFHFVCFGWILFAAPTLRAAGVALSRMLGLR
jgi:alginate O-acetyltransferase complex protein AlgI